MTAPYIAPATIARIMGDPTAIAIDQHCAQFIDRLWADQTDRHADIGRAAEQVRKWKAEDAANGMPWGQNGDDDE